MEAITTTMIAKLRCFCFISLLSYLCSQICFAFDLEGSPTSYAKYSRWDPCLNGSLSFEFKTDQPNALLMYADDGGTVDFFEVKLVGGVVRLRLNLGAGAVILTAGQQLNNQQWHTIEIRRNSQQTTLIVDNIAQTKTLKGAEFNFGNPKTNSYVFFGGLPIEYSAKLSLLTLPPVLFEPRFKGAIQNIFFRNCGVSIERPNLLDFQGIRTTLEDLCEHDNPCQNHGMCLTTDNGLVCDCSRTEYEGSHCENRKSPSLATFFGADYLSYDLSNSGDPIVSNNDQVSLHFQTRHPDGLLLYTGDGLDYMSISVKDGGIFVSVALGSGSFQAHIQPYRRRFDDNRWHHLVVKREDREIHVEIDGRQEHVGSLAGQFTLLSSSILYVAGSPNNAQLQGNMIKDNFRGCLQKVVYRADSIHLNIIDMAKERHDLISIVGDIVFDKCQSLVESQPITFTNPQSFVMLPPWKFTHNGSISFQFQTIEKDGVIMYAVGATGGDSDLFALEILEGSLFLLIDQGSGLEKLRVSRRIVSDGMNHQLSIQHTGHTGIITLDDTKTEYASEGHSDSLNLGSLYLGGIGDKANGDLLPEEMWAAMLGFGYVGCFRDLVVNGDKVELATAVREQSAAGIAEYCRVMEPQCLSRPCMHRGVCHEGWNRFICDCRATGYTGPVCQEAATTLHFDGSQWVRIDLPVESHTEAEDLSLRFKSRRANGLLFFTTSSESADFMELILEMGTLKFTVNLGSAPKTLIVGSSLNDGDWHTVFIKRRALDVEMWVDNEPPVQDWLQGDSTVLDFQSAELGHLYVDDNNLPQKSSFVGEMQQFVLNGNQFFEMSLDGKFSNIEVTASVDKKERHIKHPVTFKSADSFVTLPLLQAYAEFSLYFQIRTTEEDGLIFFNSGKEREFIAIEMTGGYLHYVYNAGDGATRIKANTPKINDNKWHDIAILRPRLHQHFIRIDDYPATVDTIVETSALNFDLVGALYVGSIHKSMFGSLSSSVKSHTGFQGCLASLDLNGYTPNLIEDDRRLYGSIAEGCSGPVVSCAADTCNHHGECLQHWSSTSCDCAMTSYIGELCNKESVTYLYGEGTGLITYTYPEEKRRSLVTDHLALGFMTTQSDAVLVRIDSGNSDDYIEMEIDKGYIFIVYNLGTEDHPVAEVFNKVNDGKYHVVRFTRTGPNSTIQLDDHRMQTKFPEGKQLRIFDEQAVIQIGGKKDERGQIVRPFTGHISGLVFNKLRVFDKASKHDDRITLEGDVTLDVIGAQSQAGYEHGWQSTQGVRQTTPRQGVTDDIIFAAGGSGCHSDDEDEDCLDTAPGHEDDIITTVVIITTTEPQSGNDGEKASRTTPSKSCADGNTERCRGNKKGKNKNKNRKPKNGNTKGTQKGQQDRKVTDVDEIVHTTLDPKSGLTHREVHPDPETEEVVDDGGFKIGYIIAIVVGLLVLILILLFVLYKYRRGYRSGGSYRVDETANFASSGETKKLTTNGGLKHSSNGASNKMASSSSTSSSKKRDVKEWYV